ncbi:pyridoxamine 5'-phosphate oxidase [Thermomonospora umbrina]|uniref:Pyridoxamine 5'-phosphate oxidase n=2 Tax=Thermomonospora umbrina TaxID=111806 RepID=A0A3D9SPH6_9ACTN|nr:pyridoxamine 5'-phosphate oxidase [Thermomonospora umbrina]
MDLPQGDVRLLGTEAAQRLLGSTELARLAYVAADGTPRVMPMMFHWTGEDVVMWSFAGAGKLPALRARPDVALTIDVNAYPPEVLMLRGEAALTEVDGIVPEYVLALHRYHGEGREEQVAAMVAEIERPGLRMARIAVRPTWAGLLDFRTRLPAVLAEQGR